MATSASHVTELLPGFLTVRIMQLIGTLVVLGMEAYIVAWGGGYATVASILALTTVVEISCYLVKGCSHYPVRFHIDRVDLAAVHMFVLRFSAICIR